MSAKIKLKRGTTASWANSSKDNKLSSGELGIEYLTSGNIRLKAGKSGETSTAWSSCDYVTANPDMYTDDGIYILDYSNEAVGFVGYAEGLTTSGVNIQGYSNELGTSVHGITVDNSGIRLNDLNMQIGSSAIPLNKLYIGKDPSSSISGSAGEIIYSGTTIFGAKQIPVLYVQENGNAALPYLNIGTNRASTDGTFFHTNISGYSRVNIYGGTSNSGVTFNGAIVSSTSDSISITDASQYNTLLLNPTTNTVGSTTMNGGATSLNIVAKDGSTLVSNGYLIFDNHITTSYSATGLYENSVALYARNVNRNNKLIDTSVNLGLSGFPWHNVYLKKIMFNDSVAALQINSNNVQIGTYSNSTNSAIKSVNFAAYNARMYLEDGTLRPSINSTSSSSGLALGDSSYKWREVWAYSGTIQTSDREAKTSIHYIDEPISKKVAARTAVEPNSSIDTPVTTDDVIKFVKALRPTTFCYLDGNGEATEENSNPEMIQLGLIADDMIDDKLFKYVGVETSADEIVEPEEVDDTTGEITKEAVIETKIVRGLQPIPLATAALTACKYLINKIETLEAEIETLKN